jgi:hypothetical protein
MIYMHTCQLTQNALPQWRCGSDLVFPKLRRRAFQSHARCMSDMLIRMFEMRDHMESFLCILRPLRLQFTAQRPQGF